MRVVCFNPSNLAPYHFSRFDRLACRGLDVHVAACPVGEHLRPWSSDRRPEFSIDKPFSGSASWRRTFREARQYLRNTEPDVALFVGYKSRFMLCGALAARLRRVPTVLVLIGWRGERSRRWLTEQVKRVACRALFGAALVPGIRAEEYATWLGIRPRRVFRVGNVVDNDHFAQGEAQPREGGFVCLARLAPAKNLDKLIDAYAAYRRQGGTWTLDIFGTGPQEAMLMERAAPVDGLEIHSWAGYDDVPGLLGRARALVLPSLVEPWGLAVNEAMAAGLPVVVSRTCGCYPELCHAGQNGLGVDPRSVDDIAAALLEMERLGEAARRQMGQMSKNLIAQYSIDSWADSVVIATAALASSRP